MILTREFKVKWNWIEKTVFRFLFVYFSLYIFGRFISPLWKPITKWLGESVFNISYTYNVNGFGSGDNTHQYLLTFTYLILAIFGCLIWSIIDRKRKSYNALFYGFLVTLRITLVFFMLIYGFIKVFHMQMIPPTYSKLIQPLGEMSPMGLAWTFMGFSKGYSIFAGGIEVLAGLLLFSRKTITLGALVIMGVMTQVFIMNLCFDIPVKLFSFHLLLMGVILFLSNSKRFLNSIILEKKVEKEIKFPKHNKESFTIITIAKIFFLVLFSAFFIYTSYSRGEKMLSKLETPFAGVYEVSSFKKKGENIDPNLIYKSSWRFLIIDVNTKMTVYTFDNKKLNYYTTIDTIAKKIGFKKTKEQEDNWVNYDLNKGALKLNGLFEKDTLEIQLLRKTKQDFLLTSRGFNWINEKPFNR